jgi:hypothetical protein
MTSRKLKVGHVLGLVAAHGVHTQRETVAQVSDAVLPVATKVNGQRTWSPEQADLVVAALILHRRWGFDLDEVREIMSDRSSAEAAVQRMRDHVDKLADKLGLVGAA